MGLHDISAEHLASSNTTVVRALRGWIAALGPTIRPIVSPEDAVFLLQTKPRLVLGVRFHQPYGFVAIIELVWGSIGIPGLSHDQDVVATTERIGKDGYGADVHIGIVAWSLAGGRPVEVPFWELLVVFDRFGKSLY